MSIDETLFPFEFIVQGTPRSLQSDNKQAKRDWKDTVNAAAQERQLETYPLGFLDVRPLAVTIYYFPVAPIDGDVDNIVKLILDGMRTIAYPDDHVVERVEVQKFEPGIIWEIEDPSPQLAAALDMEPPLVYIRVTDDLAWRSAR